METPDEPLKFYKVIRPYCTPSIAYTFAFTKKKAVLKVAKKYGFVTNSKAQELKGLELQEFIS